MKQYLLTMSVLLLAALIAGVVVWYVYQGVRLGKFSDGEVSIPEDAAQQSSTTEPEVQTEETADTSAPTEPMVITADSLSDDQRAMLATFGVNANGFVVTEAMLTCSKNAIGTTRLGEILGGAAPTPLEAMKLLPCMQK